MKTLKVLLLLCLVSCLEGWSQLIYVTQSGEGTHSGESWSNAISSKEFPKYFEDEPSGTTFKMESGKYYPGDGMSGFVTDKSFVIEGGYTVSAGVGSRDLDEMSESEMTILVGDISSDPSENLPVSITADGPVEFSGVIFESSAESGVFVMNNVSTGDEMVFKRGVARRTSALPCSGVAGESFTVSITVGSSYKIGDKEEVFNTIGTQTREYSYRNDEGCTVSDSYVINVMPVPNVIEKQNHYYVTENGKGDGSSWKSPMGNDAFAFAIDKVDDGSTFHFATGTYTGINSSFITHKCISFVGGYSGDPSDLEPHPEKNIVVFDSSLVITQIMASNPIYLSGIQFNSLHGYSLQVDGNAHGGGGNSHLLVEKCTFTGNSSLFFEISTEIVDCSFYSGIFFNYIYGMVAFEQELSFTSSLLQDVMIVQYDTKNAVYTNCTFAGSSTLVLNNCVATLKNNTCVGEFQFAPNDPWEVTLVGNIFTSGDGIHKAPTFSSNNIFPEGTSITWTSEGDRIVPAELLKAALDFDEEGNPVLTLADGFTKTVALKSDTLSDGTSLRFIRGVDDVDVDQRGMTRPDSTCMGAYEFGFTYKRIKLEDTTVFAGAYNDLHLQRDFLSIGEVVLCDTVRAEIGAESGGVKNVLDTIYTRKVTVLPKPTDFNYYVTVNGTEGGDGSSWATAMSNEEFAFAFDKVEDGSTFHFAAGTYSPVYANYGNNSGQPMKSFWTDRCVNLVGGYTANPAEGEKPHPGTDETLTSFEGDYCAIVYQPASECVNPIEVSGFTFHTRSNSQGKGCPLIVDGGDKHVQLLVGNSTFYQSFYGISMTNVSAEISNCYFHDFDNGTWTLKGGDKRDVDLKVLSSLFSHNNNFLWAGGVNRYDFVNCTFVDNAIYAGSGVSFASDVQLLNNTFFDEVNFDNNSTVKLNGNLFLGGASCKEGCSIESKYNVYPIDSVGDWTTGDDILASAESLQTLHVYKDGKPFLAQNGGWLNTVALKVDTLPDGTSIRFMRKGVTNVDVDQRGEPRSDSTCMGAYELGLSSVIIYLQSIEKTACQYTDDHGTGKTVDLSVGDYVWRDTVLATTSDGIDTIYIRDITVLPNAYKASDGSLHYYVKQDGSGDGSSWENAMGNSAFSYSFDKVEDGSTFHFAAGEYTPVDVKYDDQLCFWTNRKINLVGGYSDNPSMKDKPTPGNINNIAHFKGKTYVFVFEPTSEGDIHLTGIDIDSEIGSSGRTFILNGGDNRICLTADTCSFATSNILTNVSATIRGCEFNGYNTVFTFTRGGYLNISSSFVQGSMDIGKDMIDTVIIANSTVGTINFEDFSYVSLVNNTVLGWTEISGDDETSVHLVGNIFDKPTELTGCVVASSYNLYADSTYDWMSASDIVAAQKDIRSIWDFNYDINTANYQGNGGLTKNVALLSDELPGGISIRFKRIGVTDIDVDQRNYSRADSTCMGAYEFALGSFDVKLNDTLVYAGPYVDAVHGIESVDLQVGDTVLSGTVLGGDGQPDIVYTRKVTVMPKAYEDEQNALHYYVKVNGDGDGSSWANAMSADAFAFALNKVEDNVTFHIAEGTYYPVYTSAGVSDTATPADKTYFVTNSVKLIGGYSQDELNLSALPDTSYKTIFDGSYGGTDKTLWANNILQFKPTVSGKTLSCEYLHFNKSNESSSSVSVDVPLTISSHCVFDKCVFDQSRHALISNNCAPVIRDCNFLYEEWDPYMVNITGTSTDTLLIERTFVQGFVHIADYNFCFKNSTTTLLRVEDATIVKLTGLVLNSTIGDYYVGQDRVHVLKGNIIVNAIYGSDNVDPKTLVVLSENNIYKEGFGFAKESDKELTDDEMRSIVLWALFQNNGGYSNTLALLSDTLPSGESIRYMQSGTSWVETDQRGVIRSEETCPGAYEFGCTPTLVTINDVLVEYSGDRLPGCYVDTISSVDKGGCNHDTILSYTILPPDRDDYYVKVTPQGKGDGSSWDNAMGNEAFQLSLLHSNGGKTYYVAEGKYEPYFDSLGHVPDSIQDRCFYTNKSVSIVGGFSSLATEGYKQVLSQNPTIFYAGEGDKEVKKLFVANVSESELVTLDGITFKANRDSDVVKCEAVAVNPELNTTGGKVNIVNCTFQDSYKGLSLRNCVGNVSGCNFIDNEACGLFVKAYQGLAPVYVDSSYFSGNSHGLNVCSGSDFHLVNSTFVGNIQTAMDVSQGEYAKYEMYYNTILDSVSVDCANSQLDWTGNIFGSIVIKNETLSPFMMSGTSNIYVDKNTIPEINSSDLVLSEHDLYSLFDTDDKGDLKVIRGSNYTYYVPLKSDRLSNGQSIRFERVTEDDVDQRGVSRMPLTNRGSYELLCKYDTVEVGQKIYDRIFESFGIYELSCLDTMKSGVELVKHIIFVKPSSEPKDYYVKIYGEGTHNGLSWKNAMSGEEFAWILPMVPDRSTFHIAEGVYSPIYDMNNDSLPVDVRSKVYYTEHLVNFKGGYSHDVTNIDELPDPSKFFTVFSGYGNADDVALSDNKYNLLRIEPKKGGEMSVSGIVFEETSDVQGSGAIIMDAKNSDVTLILNRCVVKNSHTGVMAGSCSLVVSECFFTDDSFAVVSSGDKLGKMEISSSTFSDGKVGVNCDGVSHDLVISNSTFIDYSESAIDYVSLNSLSTSKLTNNTILSDMTIASMSNYECVGNIFAGYFNVLNTDSNSLLSYVSSYNIYLKDPESHNKGVLMLSENGEDLWLLRDDFRDFLQSTSSGSFVLNDNGGFTPTVAVVVDSIQGVGSIRFPKLFTSVSTDQRGVARKRNTCMGAYELDRYVELDIPSAFTPYTQDGLNDVFMPEYEVYIYDRYGRLIAHSLNGWDGTYDGSLADPGVYVYVLLDPEGDVRKGTIDILKAK